MNLPRRKRPIFALVVATALLAGCASPDPQPFAREAAEMVEARVGAAPRWRGGAEASPEEERRVRAILAGPLDANGAVEVALVRSRRLQALVEHAIAEGLAANADAAPGNPVLDFLVRWPHGSGGPIVDAGLSFGLLDVLRLPGRSEAAALAARGAALDAADAIVRAVAEVREAWVEAVAAREREGLEADVTETAAISADLAARQHAAGTLAQFDAVRLRAFADEASVALERSRTQSIAATERLVRALGVFGDEATPTLAAHLPALPDAGRETDDAERLAVARRIDLERARVAVLETRLAAGLAADERMLPDLEAGVSFERESDGRRSTGPGVSVVLPLSPKAAAQAEAASASAREAEDRLFDLAVRVRSEAREAAAGFRGASVVAARYRDSIVPLRAAAVEETQLRYNGMLVGVHDLLAEKREELRARRDLVDADRDVWIARIRFDLALGATPSPGTTPAAAAGPADEDPHRQHRHGGN